MPARKKKKSGLSKTLGIGAAVAASVAAGSLIFTSVRGKPPVELPTTTIARVIDGDTLVTKEHQIIRLSSVDAPESELCGGEEAKKALERLVLGKKAYIRALFTDSFRRSISLVYTADGFVNEAMIEGGYAQYRRTLADGSEKMKQASERAIGNRRGIHGPPCTQRINTKDRACTIKGNVRRGDHIYFPPDCIPYYDQSLIQLHLGDRWFCTEEEAKKAGFRKPKSCR